MDLDACILQYMYNPIFEHVISCYFQTSWVFLLTHSFKFYLAQVNCGKFLELQLDYGVWSLDASYIYEYVIWV
jgi:hypothetical protein